MFRPLSLIALVAALMFARPARADERADISDALSRVATTADAFAGGMPAARRACCTDGGNPSAACPPAQTKDKAKPATTERFMARFY